MESLIDFSMMDKSSTELVKLSRKKKKTTKENLSSTKGLMEILSSKDIVNSLELTFQNNKYLVNNVYIFQWESDFFCMSESGYFYEIEIKVSRSDFKDDFNKTDKHLLLESQDQGKCLKMPNKFFYAVPKGLLATYEIPKYADLIEIESSNKPANIVVNAPFLHKESLMSTLQPILMDKFYYKYRDLLTKTKEIDLEC